MPLYTLCEHFSYNYAGFGANKVPEVLQADLADFVEWLLKHHPLEGNIRLCNKILPLCNSSFHKQFVDAAAQLHKSIEGQSAVAYNELVQSTNLDLLIAEIDQISLTATTTWQQQSSQHKLPDTNIKNNYIVGVPRWYTRADDVVDNKILAQLLLRCDYFSLWNEGPDHSTVQNDEADAVVDVQDIIGEHMQKVLQSECIHMFAFAFALLCMFVFVLVVLLVLLVVCLL